MKIRLFMLLFLLLTATAANAQNKKPLNELFLMADDDEGTFLGSFENNECASKSIFDKFGTYSSQFSSTSIFNQFSQYGSEFSDYSAFNKRAEHPPIIVDDEGNIYGVLSMNPRAEGVTEDSYQLAKRLKIRWNMLNK